MLKVYSLYYFYLILSLLGMAFLGLFTSSFLLMWMVMELNLIFFLIILYLGDSHKIMNSILMVYYFLQSLSSMMLLMFFLFINLGGFDDLLVVFFFVKLGVCPFHYWFITLMKAVSWESGLFLTTLQKFLPLYMFYQLMLIKYSFWFYMLIFLIFMFKSLNLFNLKVLVGYSSVVQTYWMLVTMFFSFYMFMNYVFVYFFNISLLIYVFILNKLANLGDMYILFTGGMLSLFILGMSFSGLPMSMMFFLKMVIFEGLILKWGLFILIFYSSLFVMFYMRLLYKSLLLFNVWVKIGLGETHFKIIYLMLGFIYVMFYIPFYFFI